MKFLPNLLAALLMAQCALVFAKGNADTIFYGAPILTVNSKNEEVQALAIQNGKIVAVGSKDIVSKDWQSSGTKVVDLKGQTLMPGFVEPHVHIIVTVLTRLIDYKMDPLTALAKPRFFLGKTFSDTRDSLKLEKDAGQEVFVKLGRRGHEMSEIAAQSPLVGHPGAIVIDYQAKKIIGAHDPRSDGKALGV